jgi:hypothetical protein
LLNLGIESRLASLRRSVDGDFGIGRRRVKSDSQASMALARPVVAPLTRAVRLKMTGRIAIVVVKTWSFVSIFMYKHFQGVS